MKRFYKCLGVATIVASSWLARTAEAYFAIPILSREENTFEHIWLVIESEIKRWKQEGLKYRELARTDLLGRVGGGSLGESEIIHQVEDAAKDGSGAIQKVAFSLPHVKHLQKYTDSLPDIEENYVIAPNKGLKYTSSALENIRENQRIAINDMATKGIALAAVDTVWTSINAGDSDPDTRAGDIAQAKDVNAMIELMVGLKRAQYERALRISAIEAADASLQAMQMLQKLGKTASSHVREGGKI